jgi:hypothetical protein
MTTKFPNNFAKMSIFQLWIKKIFLHGIKISRSITLNSCHMNISFSTSPRQHWLICVMFPDASTIGSVVSRFCPLNWIRCSLSQQRCLVEKIMDLMRGSTKATLCRQVVHAKPRMDPLPSAKSWCCPTSASPASTGLVTMMPYKRAWSYSPSIEVVSSRAFWNISAIFLSV